MTVQGDGAGEGKLPALSLCAQSHKRAFVVRDFNQANLVTKHFVIMLTLPEIHQSPVQPKLERSRQ